jgi:hypothetical protein
MSVETYESLTQDKAPTSAPGFTLETMPDDVTQGLLALADQYEREDLDGGPEHSPQSGGRLRPSRHSTVSDQERARGNSSRGLRLEPPFLLREREIPAPFGWGVLHCGSLSAAHIEALFRRTLHDEQASCGKEQRVRFALWEGFRLQRFGNVKEVESTATWRRQLRIEQRLQQLRRGKTGGTAIAWTWNGSSQRK